MCIHVAGKRRVQEAGAFGRAEIAMPLSGIPALWISTGSLVIHNLVSTQRLSLDATSNTKDGSLSR